MAEKVDTSAVDKMRRNRNGWIALVIAVVSLVLGILAK